MPQNESFFGYLNGLVQEARDALGDEAKVHDPREYRFDIEFSDRRYALQGYPEEQRIFVGQYLGDRGVVWFDELRFDDTRHGWRSSRESATDFFRALVRKPTLTHADAERAAAEKPQSGEKESPTSVEASVAAHQRAEQAQQREAAAEETLPETLQGVLESGEEKFVQLARRAYRSVQSARTQLRTPWSAAKRTANRLLRRGPTA
jgi:hypothetical protein